MKSMRFTYGSYAPFASSLSILREIRRKWDESKNDEEFYNSLTLVEKGKLVEFETWANNGFPGGN